MDDIPLESRLRGLEDWEIDNWYLLHPQEPENDRSTCPNKEENSDWQFLSTKKLKIEAKKDKKTKHSKASKKSNLNSTEEKVVSIPIKVIKVDPYEYLGVCEKARTFGRKSSAIATTCGLVMGYAAKLALQDSHYFMPAFGAFVGAAIGGVISQRLENHDARNKSIQRKIRRAALDGALSTAAIMGGVVLGTSIALSALNTDKIHSANILSRLSLEKIINSPLAEKCSIVALPLMGVGYGIFAGIGATLTGYRIASVSAKHSNFP